MSTRIFEQAVTQVIASTSGAVAIRLTGTKWGLSYSHWDTLIGADLKERKYATPRCQRLRQWDVDTRLDQLCPNDIDRTTRALYVNVRSCTKEEPHEI